MLYDSSFFDEPFSRLGTNSEKWEGLQVREGENILPMWVADMDVRCATEIMEALKHRANHEAYGYTRVSSQHTQDMLDFFERRHGIHLTQQQQTMLPCVVTGLRAAVRALTEAGDLIILQSPVYGPFFSAIQENDRIVADSPLLRDGQGNYHMDFEGLEKQCRAGAKLMLLCNPHNPVGRLWTSEELSRLYQLLSAYRIPLVSDEIHWDFAFDGQTVCSALSIQEAKDPLSSIVTITSASKTFNIAGLQQAVLLTRNASLLESLQLEMRRAGVTQGNIFAMEATAAAYRHGDAWLDGLIAYLHQSRILLQQELKMRLPEAILTPIQGTYLAWVDMRAYGFSSEQLRQRTHESGVSFSSGTDFGVAGEGFLRINFACSHSQLRLAMERLEKAVLA